MQKPQNWDEVEAVTGDFKALTAGGYICKIIEAKAELSKSGKEMLVIAFDIAEGESKDFYLEQYGNKLANNPETKWQGVYRQLTEGNSEKFFKGILTSIENSNPGYTWNWDERTLKGKLFGGVFGEEEYLSNDGEIKTSVKCRFIRSIEQIKKGVKIPDVKKIENNTSGFNTNTFGSQVFPDEPVPF